MNKKNKITVIIPFYNTEAHIKKCLDSVINQSLREIEIICVNDGSMDSSIKIVNEYARNDSRIRIINQNNKGSGPARNLAISISDGEYLSFIDSDDYYPNKEVLVTLYKKAITNKALICGGGLAFDIDGKIEKDDNPNSTFRKESTIRYRDYQWDYGFYRYIFSTTFIKNNNIYFPELRRYQDPPFLIRAMIKANEFYAVKEITYCYRLRNLNDINWEENIINDLANGLLFCISTASYNKLFKNVANHIEMINENYKDIIIKSLLNNNNYLRTIMKDIINETEREEYKKSIYYCGLEQSIIDLTDFERSKKETKQAKTLIKKTTKKIRKTIIYINDYGLIYTLKREVNKLINLKNKKR